MEGQFLFTDLSLTQKNISEKSADQPRNLLFLDCVSSNRFLFLVSELMTIELHRL